ncbi:nicotinate phosphoribosyltransferase [Rhizobium sp. YJ-22]|uniref:nicotinate phosphoribosyltransferase n=1 Tax=Rhizobium sp. YJ-22 TaxID=3037556 RepID=UPI001ACB472C|nr:nicotinate phosphoribosyltransferase [Rhizobium sp. YJ-22]MBN9032697.1 nicotinate phosphoribosyltransferase [Hyphomicrobiales bacterium]MDG3575555.1 nicotinate phosphoribosyltransferase [Rhizobium sp. YJ-22]
MPHSNPILNVDSYKLSHFLQYPPGVRSISAYVEARGMSQRPEVVFFGLQMFLKDYLARAVTKADIMEAAEVSALHGVPFNRQGWLDIVDRHGGFLPLRIEALPEGQVVRRGVPLIQVVNTDPDFAWLTTYVETALLRAVWYPATVASHARRLSDMLLQALEKTCDAPAEVLPTRLHDFGARAATSAEQAGLGGAAHLLYFSLTDTLSGILHARRFYGAPMAGTSYPGAEHSTVTAWGPQRETQAYEHMLDAFGDETFSVVSDSYDIANAVSEIWGKALKDRVQGLSGRLIVRPDSGDPVDTPMQAVNQLAYAFGTRLNGKGYKVIDAPVEVLQGDGASGQDIAMILGRLEGMGFSAENIRFGMGSGLLQKVTRDSYSFTMKANACEDADGVWHGIAKRPATMREKASRNGRVAVVEQFGELVGVSLEEVGGRHNHLAPVWENGKLLRDWSFDEVKARAQGAGL